jgi:high-affinity iron transporter
MAARARIAAVFFAASLSASLVCAAPARAAEPAAAASTTATATAGPSIPTVLHLLDYVAADYSGAVENGKVKNENEYKENLEFAMRAVDMTKALPANPALATLSTQADAFVALVRARARAGDVAAASSALRRAIVTAYHVPDAPTRAPDVARGAALFTTNCAGCHGATGLGDGPAGRGLDPVPANFHNARRMDQRSVFGLYNTISLGVPGTAMPPFGQLKDDERWALAFYVAGLRAGTAAQAGGTLWQAQNDAGARLRAAFPGYASVVTQSVNEVRARLGNNGVALQAYLVAHPEALDKALAAAKPDPIAFARQRMGEAVAAYEKGDREGAQRIAVSAYLDGFEIAESGLDNVDAGLRAEIEGKMLGFRSTLAGGGDAGAVKSQAAAIDDLLSQAGEKLSGGGLSPTAAFVSSFVILLREGLEAILLLAAIIAFVSRTGRREALPWVHAGWAAALALGALTWFTARYVISISGANRELTEGVTGILASVMLLYVGYWLHGKSQAQAWSHFLRSQVDSALQRRTLRAMAAISFIAVYREIFEVVLFYEALWVQAGDGGHSAVAGGIAAAAVALAVAGWAIFRYSVRLPLGPFFTAMALLMAVMAVAFAGQGVKALQEANLVGVHPVPFITVPVLGIFPTLQTLGAQLLALAVAVLGYVGMNRPRGDAAPASAPPSKELPT